MGRTTAERLKGNRGFQKIPHIRAVGVLMVTEDTAQHRLFPFDHEVAAVDIAELGGWSIGTVRKPDGILRNTIVDPIRRFQRYGQVLRTGEHKTVFPLRFAFGSFLRAYRKNRLRKTGIGLTGIGKGYRIPFRLKQPLSIERHGGGLCIHGVLHHTNHVPFGFLIASQ